MHDLINIDLNRINLSINTSNSKANGLRLVLPAPHINIMLNSFAGKKWNALPINANYICFIGIFLNYVWHVFV